MIKSPLKWIFYPERPQVLALVRLVMMAGALLFLSRDLVHYESPLANPVPFELKGVFRILPAPLGEGSLFFFQLLWWASCFSALIGYRTRISLTLAFVSGLVVHGYGYNFARTYHHAQTFLLLIFVLAAAPSGDAWSLDAWIRRRRGAVPPAPSERYSWGLRLGQFLIVLFYTATGFAKLSVSGWAWAFSDALAVRLAQAPFRTPLGNWLLAQPPPLLRGIAFFVLLAELISPLALLHRRLALAVLLAWATLHVGVYLAMGEHAKFFVLFICYAFFLGRGGPSVNPTTVPSSPEALGLKSGPRSR